MRIQSALVVSALLLLAGFSLATYYLGHGFHHHPNLGPRLALSDSIILYPPWSPLIWQSQFGEQFPHPFAKSTLILILSFFAALIPIRLAVRDRDFHKPFGLKAWGTYEDAEAAGLLAETGTILGKLDGRILCYDGMEHQLLIGASRSGKGRGHVVPTLLNWKNSALVLDVKGELADGDDRHGFLGTAGYRERLGPVLRFAPTRQDSAAFNPLMEVRIGVNEVRDVQNIIEIIADPAGDQRFKDFWNDAAKNVLTGIILHVLYTEPVERKSLAVVREKLADLKATCELMGRTLHRLNPKTGEPEILPECLQGSKSFSAYEHKMQTGLKATTESFFGLFADPLVAANTSRSDFRLSDLMCGPKPVTLYLQPPPSDAMRLMPLMRLLLNQLARSQMEYQGLGSDGRVKKHTLLLCLDEFPQLGKMPFFETAMGAFAGYGLKAYLVCQSLNHIIRAYGRDNVILDNCHIVTAFAAADMNTAEQIARMAGEAWEMRPQRSEMRPSSILGPKKGTITWREERRALLMPGDVRQLKRDEQLIFVSGTKPLRTKKIRFDQEKFFVQFLKPASNTTVQLSTTHDWTDVMPVGFTPPPPGPRPTPSSSRGASKRPPTPDPAAETPQPDLFSQTQSGADSDPPSDQRPSISQQASAGIQRPEHFAGDIAPPEPPLYDTRDHTKKFRI
jgi:type IV secretion system protein VirD4